MTETRSGSNRSAGIDYLKLLDEDSHPVRDSLRVESPMEPGPTLVPVERYFSKEFHDVEVEKVWKRIWQMACHEDDIPDVGDYLVYNIAELSFLVVRSEPDEFKVFHNACLHRGRMLRENDGKWARELRCPFHGWSWNLDGSLKEIPCEWDFPSVDPAKYCLPEVKVGRWGGFIFVNFDDDAAPLEEYLGVLPEHFAEWDLGERYVEVHIRKRLPANWKAAAGAFLEAYHVLETHSQAIYTAGDANAQYDVFDDNVTRFVHTIATTSPHVPEAKRPDEQQLLEMMMMRKDPGEGDSGTFAAGLAAR